MKYSYFFQKAVAMQEQMRLDEALDFYKKAIEIDPVEATSHWNMGWIQLLKGDYLEGFKRWELRWLFHKKHGFDIHSLFPNKKYWRGEENKKIFLFNEEGAGDLFHFARYIPLIKAKSITLECWEKEAKLLENLNCNIVIRSRQDPLKNYSGDFEYYASLGSMPNIFKTTLETVPNTIPYLFPIKKQFEFDKNKFKIGIAWTGSVVNKTDAIRSCSLKYFREISQLPGVQLYSLQKNAPSKRQWGNKVVDLLEGSEDISVIKLDHLLNDFNDTANVIQEMDLIISITTSAVSIAGAIGKPVWVLLAFTPDWRWLDRGEHSPWYPTAKLFRQKKAGDWESVFDNVLSNLRHVFLSGGTTPK